MNIKQCCCSVFESSTNILCRVPRTIRISLIGWLHCLNQNELWRDGVLLSRRTDHYRSMARYAFWTLPVLWLKLVQPSSTSPYESTSICNKVFFMVIWFHLAFGKWSLMLLLEQWSPLSLLEKWCPHILKNDGVIRSRIFHHYRYSARTVSTTFRHIWSPW